MALWGVPALLALAPDGKIPRVEQIHVDGWVLAFTIGVSMIAGIAFGLAPAFQGARRELRDALSQSAAILAAAGWNGAMCFVVGRFLCVEPAAARMAALRGSWRAVRRFVWFGSFSVATVFKVFIRRVSVAPSESLSQRPCRRVFVGILCRKTLSK
jgi:hypothetical protein